MEGQGMTVSWPFVAVVSLCPGAMMRHLQEVGVVLQVVCLQMTMRMENLGMVISSPI
jgi:predicted ATP-dependent Lon-type protease